MTKLEDETEYIQLDIEDHNAAVEAAQDVAAIAEALRSSTLEGSARAQFCSMLVRAAKSIRSSLRVL